MVPQVPRSFVFQLRGPIADQRESAGGLASLINDKETLTIGAVVVTGKSPVRNRREILPAEMAVPAFGPYPQGSCGRRDQWDARVATAAHLREESCYRLSVIWELAPSKSVTVPNLRLWNR
jgi:hypothetical protein